MFKVSRRNLILSSGAAAAVFGIDKQVAWIDSAYAQKAPEAAAGAAAAPPVGAGAAAFKPFAKFNVGKAKVTTIFDGLWEKPHDAGFIKNASVEETKTALTAAKSTAPYVPVPFTVTVVNTGKNLVMFDAGGGGQATPANLGKTGLMTANMKAAGIDADKIDTILVTHFHPDHIFGLMAKDTNAPVFAKAKIVMPENEYKFWTDPALIDKLPEARKGLGRRIQAVFPAWKDKGYITLAAIGAEVLPGIRMVDTAGHTPGHVSYHVSSGKSQLMVSSDASQIALFLKNPAWHGAFDVDPVLAEKNRRALFDRVIAEKMVVTGYHWGMPGAGTIQKDGNGYALVPVNV